VAVVVLDALPGDASDEVRTLINTVRHRDDAPPLSDHAMLRLTEAQPGLRHLVARADSALSGYAQLDDDTAEIADLAGASDALLAALEPMAPRLLVWSHGKRSPVAPAAAARGYVKQRTLWQLRRTLADLPHQPLPAGVTLRSFVPGQDEDAWLAANAAAFADHAEQGRWTRVDIEAREAEPWFDPAGFLLAERDGALVGFHWTKMHPDGVGEVYVLGVSPKAQGGGLGLALLSAGLEHLAARGIRDVLLYVDDSNAAAMGLYRRYGFTTYDLDIQYARAP
jgi:mycothiol synthase